MACHEEREMHSCSWRVSAITMAMALALCFIPGVDGGKRTDHENEIFISGNSLAVISISFGLFGVLFIVNTIMCCYNCYAFSLFANKRKFKVSRFDEDSDDEPHEDGL